MKTATTMTALSLEELKQIWAKRQIKVLPLYLAQREGFEELTWEPAAHFSPKILRDFEQQYEDSLDAQSSDSSSKAEEGESNS
ncbi:hypothetical protein PI125_g12349 [Phytophthora idaei]|nr:hypothetical protein PI125_g12349 [Phytophthora idaei]KAG3147744.1 hypothetical protein PI126_g12761 [Phytophthora idaei]